MPDFRVALAGDVMMTRGLGRSPQRSTAELRSVLRSCNVACANFESTSHTFEPDITPSATTGTPMVTPPHLLPDLKWLGLDMLACANNHAFDYGERGIIHTTDHLRDAGFVAAGTGTNRRAARRPAFCERNGRRIALISVTTEFPQMGLAGPQGPDVRGRPGVSGVAITPVFEMDQPTFDTLRRYADQTGWSAQTQRMREFGFYSKSELGNNPNEQINLPGARLARAHANRVSYTVAAPHVAEVQSAIEDARHQADIVVVSLHYHDMDIAAAKGSTRISEVTTPADYVRDLSRQFVDAGADAVFCHGPHIPLGVMVYREKPIFLSLGDFLLQNDSAARLPAESYERFRLRHDAHPSDFFNLRSAGGTKGHASDSAFWTGLLPICHFDDRHITKIDLRVATLGHKAPTIGVRGVPGLAHPEQAAKATHQVLDMSDDQANHLVKLGTTNQLP